MNLRMFQGRSLCLVGGRKGEIKGLVGEKDTREELEVEGHGDLTLILPKKAVMINKI